jgi:hypothetical protein
MGPALTPIERIKSLATRRWPRRELAAADARLDCGRDEFDGGLASCILVWSDHVRFLNIILRTNIGNKAARQLGRRAPGLQAAAPVSGPARRRCSTWIDSGSGRIALGIL